jgi:hypothetical protein
VTVQGTEIGNRAHPLSCHYSPHADVAHKAMLGAHRCMQTFLLGHRMVRDQQELHRHMELDRLRIWCTCIPIAGMQH